MGVNLELFYLFFLFLVSGVIIHEYGHALTAYVFSIKILKIRFFPKPEIETEILNDADIRTLLFRLSGGFFSSLFLLLFLLIFQFKSIVYISSFGINVTEIGIFFCFIHLIGGIIEGFFNDFYMKNKLKSIFIISLSLIVYLLFNSFF